MQYTHQSRWFYAASGLMVGAVLGMNLAGLWPQQRLHASATESVDNFTVATGMAGDGVEALFFLDKLTGDLKAAVINPRPGGRNATPKFTNFYEYNITQDFAVTGGGRGGNYIMITGEAQIPRGSAGFQLGNSVIYVVDVASGDAAAYALPFNTTQFASGKPFMGTFVPLDRVKLRTAFVRE